jgi:predicted SnoaL-like aldol condensation-catalyzing enzyme
MTGLELGGAILLVGTTALVTWLLVRRAEAARQQANIDLVMAMWDGVIYQADRAAVLRYVHPDYKQHNPNVLPGREGVLQLVELIANPVPGIEPAARKTFNRAVAQGDMVVIIWDQDQPDPHNPGETYVGQAFDMFRVAGSQVVEHWDDTRKKARPWTRAAADEAKADAASAAKPQQEQ